VWASPRGQARHDVCIEVNPTHGRQMIIRDAVTVAVQSQPQQPPEPRGQLSPP